jgi:uncharacterized protein YabE (DUF348 family)
MLVLRGRAEHHLLLTVDGTPTAVLTGADTVGGLLAEQHVVLAARDQVRPALDAPLADAPEVTVDRSRSVALTLDGRARTVSTTASEVGGLLATLDLPEGSYVSASPLAPLPLRGATLTVRTPKAVTAVVGGSTVRLDTTAATVGEALAAPPVGLRGEDLVSVPRGEPVVAGATYRVTRVRVVERTRRTLLRADTRWVRRPAMAAGTSRVLTTGSDGERVREVRLRYQNGAVVEQKVLSDKVVARPVDWVIAVGTGTPTSSSSTTITYEKHWAPATGKVDGDPDFAALAKCESGGNPRAVSPTGKYRGLYQFDLRTWHGVGGVGDPIDASPAEQTKRARILYDDRGRSPWPYCGRFL